MGPKSRPYQVSQKTFYIESVLVNPSQRHWRAFTVRSLSATVAAGEFLYHKYD